MDIERVADDSSSTIARSHRALSKQLRAVTTALERNHGISELLKQLSDTAKSNSNDAKLSESTESEDLVGCVNYNRRSDCM